MKIVLTNFKVNVLSYKYEITGEVECKQNMSANGLKEIEIEDVSLTNVMCMNHCEELYPLNDVGMNNFAKDLKANPIKYTPIVWYIQAQFEKEEREKLTDNSDNEIEVEFLD